MLFLDFILVTRLIQFSSIDTLLLVIQPIAYRHRVACILDKPQQAHLTAISGDTTFRSRDTFTGDDRSRHSDH